SGRPLTVLPQQLVDIDLVFEGQTEIWDFGRALSGESWASFHYEQSGRLHGSIEVDGQSIDFDAVAHRDHSRGPRRYSGIESGTWMQGHFPGGRSFALIDSKWTGKDRHAMARVFQDGRIYEAKCDVAPSLDAYDGLPKSFVLRLESELGEMEVAGECVKGLPQTFDDRNEVLYGSATFAGVTAMCAIVGPTSLHWNGLAGVGHADFCWGPRFDV
ncbi:MAG: hypothetical protein JO278_06035, partial [Dyella sp.]|nr:hypothetical protein [Dyella sp.]MBV8272011.1 hypothetical protein [Cupriavidus sp.]